MRKIAGRPALAAACARVTSRHARKQADMGNYCVRGTAPKNQCILTSEFFLDAAGGAR
jgi:hypothetical protein